MDDLEEGAAAHTKYTRTNADWLQVMTHALINAPILPAYQKDRLKIYQGVSVPDRVGMSLDLRAFDEAIQKMHKGLHHEKGDHK